MRGGVSFHASGVSDPVYLRVNYNEGGVGGTKGKCTVAAALLALFMAFTNAVGAAGVRCGRDSI